MHSAMVGEFMGTMMLILLGDGVVAGVLLKKSKAENAGWMVITAGWAFAVLCGIFTAILFGSKDAHINPAITLAFAISAALFGLGVLLALVLLPSKRRLDQLRAESTLVDSSAAGREPVRNVVSSD